MCSGLADLFARFWTAVTYWQTNDIVDWCTVGYWVAIFIALSIVGMFFLSNRKMARILDKIFNNLLLMSVGVWFLGVVVYIIGLYNNQLIWSSVIPRAVISSFKMFAVAHDLARVNATLHSSDAYMTLFSVVHLLAAFITFLFVFKMIGYKIKSSWQMLWHKWWHAKGKRIHLFLGVNEASLLMAEDVRRHYPADTIIFIDVDAECDDDTQKKPTLIHVTNTITIGNRDMQRLENIEALVDHCYNGPAALSNMSGDDVFGALHLRSIGVILKKSNKANIYFLSDNEAQNIVGALNLQRDYRMQAMYDSESTIYVHAHRDANNEVFDHYSQYDDDSRRMKIKIVDSAYLSVLTLKKDNNALPVHCVDVDKATGLVRSPFTALVVGFGATGQEAFKFLYEFAAFIGEDKKRRPFKCYAVDEKMDRIAGLVREKMPDIGEDQLSLLQTSVNSEKFWMMMRGIVDELNYVVIALNNDTIGLSLAVNLFKYALKHRQSHFPRLKIMVRCYDNANEKRMTEVANNLNASVGDYNIEIQLYGKEADLYSCDTILSDMTLREAKDFNKVYENSELSAEEQWEKDFGKNEINRLIREKGLSRYHAIYDVNRRITQNVSNSLHRHTKMILMGFDEETQSDRLKQYHAYVNSRKQNTKDYLCDETDKELLLNIGLVEHERWIASHKLMGYTYGKQTDLVRKCHQCMCSWNELDEQTQSYDCNVVDTTIKMACQKLST